MPHLDHIMVQCKVSQILSNTIYHTVKQHCVRLVKYSLMPLVSL